MPPPLVLGAYGEVGWLGYDRDVRLVSAQAASQRSVGAAELLIHHRLDHDVALEPNAELVQRSHRHHRRGHAALHVEDAQPVLPPLFGGAGERVHRPRIFPSRDRVHVPREQDGPSPTGPSLLPDHIWPLLVAPSAEVSGVLRQPGDVGRAERVRLAAEVFEASLDELLYFFLVTVRVAVLAGYGDQGSVEVQYGAAVLFNPIVYGPKNIQKPLIYRKSGGLGKKGDLRGGRILKKKK